MDHDLHCTLALLERTPGALSLFLRDLPSQWVFANEGGSSFNVFDVIGHLIHAERTDWMPRIRMILDFGESRTFEPFVREGFDDGNRSKLEDVLDLFIRLRSENLSELRRMNLQPEDLARSGRHPAFGAVNLSQLLATWAAHDLTHLHQISRIMAHQYREAVGPWSAYLGVLQCNGHSA